jgi:O-antigen/teichoic acid export membrane protein
LNLIKKGGIVLSFNYLAVVLGYFTSFYLLPYLLSIEQIGIYRIIFAVVGVLLPIIEFGSANVVYKFSPGKEKPELNQTYINIIIFQFIIVTTIAILYWCFPIFFLDTLNLNSEEGKTCILAILPLALSFSLISTQSAISRIHYKEILIGFINTVGFKIGPIIGVALFAYLKTPLYYIFWIILTFQLIWVIVLFIYNYKKLEINWLIKPKQLLTVENKEIRLYAITMFIGAGSSMFIQQVDVIMTGSIVGKYLAGIYGTIFVLAGILELPRRVLNSLLIPFISRAWKEKDISTVIKYYSKSSLYQFIFGSFFLILTLLNLDFIFQIIPKGDEFAIGSSALIIILIAKLYDMLWGANNEILVLSDAYKYNVILLIILVFVAVLLNIILIPIYGIIGTALATLISIVVYNTSRGAILYYKYKIHPFSKKHFFALIYLALGLLYFFISQKYNYGSILYYTISSTLWIVATIITIKVFNLISLKELKNLGNK